jgi:hypothetical protein
MSRLVPMKVGEIEVAVEVPDRLEPAAMDVRLPQRLDEGLHQALDFVAEFARAAAERLHAALAAVAPDEVAIELGVTVGTEAGVILTSASAEGQLKVSLKWKPGGSKG